MGPGRLLATPKAFRAYFLSTDAIKSSWINIICLCLEIVSRLVKMKGSGKKPFLRELLLFVGAYLSCKGNFGKGAQ